MSILNYIASLLPTFKKDRVMEEAGITLEELESVCIPAYAEAVKASGVLKIKSKEVQEFTSIFMRIVNKPSKTGGLIGNINERLLIVRDNLKLIKDKMDSELQDTIVSEGMSVVKANILQALEGIYFISKFSTKLLNAIYVYETAERSENKEQFLKDNIIPIDIEYLKKRFPDFCFVLSSLSKPTKEIEKLLANVPDINIRSENFAAVGATLDREKVDAFALKDFVRGFAGNPIFHIGMMVAEWQANRYKKASDTKKVLELRLLNLKELNSGHNDAKIEREIQYIQNRIDDIEYKMVKMEEE